MYNKVGMKSSLFSILSLIMLIFFVAGCKSTKEQLRFVYEDESYSYKLYEKDKDTFTFSNSTGKNIRVSSKHNKYIITVEDREYTAEISGTKDNYYIDVKTPEGAGMFYQQQGTSGAGGGDLQYNEKDNNIMDSIIEVVVPVLAFGTINRGEGFKIDLFIFAVLMIALGILNTLNPELVFKLNEGWKFRNAEPSEIYLFIARLGGVVGIIIGIILIFTSCA